MKKRSRIMMMIIAILLTFVMISSCLVSSTMAKYVIKKTATTKVSLTKFGVTVTLDSTDMTKGTDIKDGKTIIVPYTATLIPSSTDTKNITASITGTPSVNTKVTIDVQVSYVGTDAFKLKAADFANIDEDTTCVPIGFKTEGASGYTVNPYNTNAAADTEKAIEQAIAAKHTFLNYDETNKNITGTLTLDPNDPSKNVLNLTNLGITLDWPLTSSVADSDIIGTYVSKTNPAIQIVYAITVEQV